MKKLNKLAILAAICCGSPAFAAEGGRASYESNEFAPLGVAQVSHCDCGEVACGCESMTPEPGCGTEMMPISEPACGIDDGTPAPMAFGGGGCEMDGCGFATGGILDQLTSCDVEEPWVLFGEACGWSAGGWTDIGYHSSNNTGLGIIGGAPGDTGSGAPANFNNYADRVQLQQQWLYLEKTADGSNGLGLGGRVDYIYGTDGPDTQAFGVANNSWDNSWDNGGAYGQAMPQLYGEVAYGDTSVKFGHFFTIVGNEVVQATGNFFYSRQFTFYNAEPFTHTGVLATHNVNDDTTVYGGYVTGWDSGFEDNGDAFLGGIKHQVTEDVSLLYTTAIGRFNDDSASNNFGERGSVHCFILQTQLTEKLLNLVQFDHLNTHDANDALVRRTYGLNNYFIYQMSDCVSLGSRSEFFNWATPQLRAANPGINNANLFNQTVGINYRANANLLLRPEMRWVVDYDKTGVNEQNSRNKAIFGMDAIFTF